MHIVEKPAFNAARPVIEPTGDEGATSPDYGEVWIPVRKKSMKFRILNSEFRIQNGSVSR